MKALADATKTYERLRLLYQELAAQCERDLKAACYENGLPCVITSRVKELPSLLKKMLGKEKSYDAVTDKIGVRVVVMRPGDYPKVRQVVANALRVVKRDNKGLLLCDDEFGYAATHFDVQVLDSVTLEPHIVEVQVHTPGMSLWSGLSHDVVYKAIREPTRHTTRSIHRLAAVAELIDTEAARIQAICGKRKGASADVILQHLERHFYPLAQRPYDLDLSFMVLEELRHAVPVEWRSRFGAELDGFVAAKKSQLMHVFAQYANDHRHLLLSQPEVLLVFMLLDKDRFELQDKWPQMLEGMLEPLAAVWGVPLPDTEG